MLKASICDYSDAYILVEGSIYVVGQGANDAAIAVDRKDKEVVFKDCALFTSRISKRNDTEADSAEDLDIVMQIYKLLENSANHAETSCSWWQYRRDEPNEDDITDSKSFKFNLTITDNINNADITNVKVVVPLKYLSNFGELLKCH